VTYKPFEVVVVPFPFTDRNADKRRPALVLSDDRQFNRLSDHAVLAMITSQKNQTGRLILRLPVIEKRVCRRLQRFV